MRHCTKHLQLLAVFVFLDLLGGCSSRSQQQANGTSGAKASPLGALIATASVPEGWEKFAPAGETVSVYFPAKPFVVKIGKDNDFRMARIERYQPKWISYSLSWEKRTRSAREAGGYVRGAIEGLKGKRKVLREEEFSDRGMRGQELVLELPSGRIGRFRVYFSRAASCVLGVEAATEEELFGSEGQRFFDSITLDVGEQD